MFCKTCVQYRGLERGGFRVRVQKKNEWLQRKIGQTDNKLTTSRLLQCTTAANFKIKLNVLSKKRGFQKFRFSCGFIEWFSNPHPTLFPILLSPWRFGALVSVPSVPWFDASSHEDECNSWLFQALCVTEEFSSRLWTTAYVTVMLTSLYQFTGLFLLSILCMRLFCTVLNAGLLLFDFVNLRKGNVT